MALAEARSIHTRRYVPTGDGDPVAAERKAWQRNSKKRRRTKDSSLPRKRTVGIWSGSCDGPMTWLNDQAAHYFVHAIARIEALGPNRRLIFTIPSVEQPDSTQNVVVKLVMSAELQIAQTLHIHFFTFSQSPTSQRMGRRKPRSWASVTFRSLVRPFQFYPCSRARTTSNRASQPSHWPPFPCRTFAGQALHFAFARPPDIQKQYQKLLCRAKRKSLRKALTLRS